MKKTSNTPKKRKRRIEKRPITSLKPHPEQANLFGDLSHVEIQQLADDLERNGQLVPIEILNDGTIICGHQRVAAFMLLGRSKRPPKPGLTVLLS